MYSPSEKTQKQVRDTFVYHSPAGNQTERYVRIRETARDLANALITNARNHGSFL